MSRNVESLTQDLVFGSAIGNTTIETDGSLRAKGNATCWDDLTSSLIGRRLDSTAGTLNYNYAENTITMQPGGSILNTSDTLMFNFQIPHAFKVDSEMRLHMHWEQPDASDREITVQYRIQDNGSTKITAWTQVVVAMNATSNVFTYTSGVLNQITGLVAVDLTGHNLSSTVQFKVARTDSTTGDIEAVFIDAHIEYDSFGSRQEYIK